MIKDYKNLIKLRRIHTERIHTEQMQNWDDDSERLICWKLCRLSVFMMKSYYNKDLKVHTEQVNKSSNNDKRLQHIHTEQCIRNKI